MTRERAFWFMVAIAVAVVLLDGLRAPSEHFWDEPPRFSITEDEAFDLVERVLGIGEKKTQQPAVPEAMDIGETILEDPPPPKVEEKKSEPKPKPKPRPKPKPAPEPEPVLEPNSDPKVDRDAVNIMMRHASPELHACYMYLTNAGHLNVDGVIVMAIHIDTDGVVTELSFREDPLRIPRMEACVSSKLVGRRIYPPPSEPFVARYPIVFTKPGAPNYEKYMNEYGSTP